MHFEYIDIKLKVRLQQGEGEKKREGTDKKTQSPGIEIAKKRPLSISTPKWETVQHVERRKVIGETRKPGVPKESCGLKTTRVITKKTI